MVFKEIATSLVAFIIYKKVKSYLEWRALRRWGEQFGCADVSVVPNKLPGGIERYSFLFMDLKSIDFLEVVIRKRFENSGYTRRIINFHSSIISTCEPKNIQAILATQFHDFDLGSSWKENLADLIGNGIFTAEGQQWIHFRQQLKPQFTRDQVSDLESAERHIQVLWRALPTENASGWVEGVDIMPLLSRFTMDVSTEFLFGQSVNSQSNALHAIDSGNTTDSQREMDFAEAMHTAQEMIIYRLRLKGLYWLVSPKKFKQACKTVKDFTDRCVQKALDQENKHAAHIAGEKKKYVLLEELAAETKDPVELRDQALHLLLAGRDTTSALLSWAITMLSRHPQEFQKLRQSIISQFGTADLPTEELTFASLKSCKDLVQFLHETLRLYPIVPMNCRRAIRNTTLPLGGGPTGQLPIAVKRGESVGYSTYAMHRRHDIWGADADEFRSSRWEGRKLGWEFIPFSGGPRVCIGQQYALNEASFVIVKLLQRYDTIEPSDPKEKIIKGITMTMCPGNGVNVKMHRA
ncbi:cytochrome P450 alkane hydroxylase-like protein [Amylocarpus encephaloides]|uniref:Cytochrome P450 alkane hydroxylase-like protein n=1 Tax=Amylocarpus encephaloides TaxID=45428 RepID=A0A9P7YQ82_9HELO|nr:cytochrome P450 alkane hydroxylase-like protein [Amylocarpus encephaloides]